VTDTDPLLGTLHYVDGRGTVRMEDVYDTTIDDLWSAIVEPDRLARWLAEVSGEPQVGGELRMSFTSGWIGTGRVDVCEAPHHLRIELDPEADQPMAIEAWLTAEGGKTRLVIEDSGFTREDLPGHGAGWQAHVEDLRTYLSGQVPGDWAPRWRELIPAYERLSAELG
jgi:uncharacterized protein YndB with AHSA1/START domain